MFNWSFLRIVGHSETVSLFADARGELRRAGVLRHLCIFFTPRAIVSACLPVRARSVSPRSLQLDIDPSCSSLVEQWGPFWLQLGRAVLTREAVGLKNMGKAGQQPLGVLWGGMH